MFKILFICHGNICRSPMAEFIFKDIVKKNNKEKDFFIKSRAVSNEETGHDIYGKAKGALERHGIPFEKHSAKIVTAEDYDSFDLLIIMDKDNRQRLLRIVGEDRENKIHLLGEYSGTNRDVSDPWFTEDFETAYKDIYDGCNGLLNALIK